MQSIQTKNMFFGYRLTVYLFVETRILNGLIDFEVWGVASLIFNVIGLTASERGWYFLNPFCAFCTCLNKEKILLHSHIIFYFLCESISQTH